MIAYLDSSVLLRVLLDQPEPLSSLWDYDQRITSALTEVECLRAVDASRLSGELTDDEYADRRASVFSQLRRMRRVAVSASVLRRAGEPLLARLRAFDAIHVATALQLRDRRMSDLVFATHDRQQGRVASLLGLEVIGV